MLHTTFNLLRRAGACETGYRKLAKSLGGIDKYGKDTPIPLAAVLDSNGINDALWCLRATIEPSEGFARDFACDCAGSVASLLTDESGITAIAVARRHVRGQVTDSELSAARAAWDAVRNAARDAWNAARDAAMASAMAAASDAARDAWNAARDAASAAAMAIAWDAAMAAAWDAASDATWDSARAAGDAARAMRATANAAARAAMAAAWDAAWDAAWEAAGDAAWDAAWDAARAAMTDRFAARLAAHDPETNPLGEKPCVC